MYQIFVVEDELLIRQNIRSIIENMQGPCASARVPQGERR